jgi:hypothetical protein
VHALHNIHAALADDAILVDTQPISPRPPVSADGIELGALDMDQWRETIDEVDALTAETIAAGLYQLQHEQTFIVTDTFDNGPECLETASGWRGTHVPAALAARIRDAPPPVTVAQEVRLRLLRRGR